MRPSRLASAVPLLAEPVTGTNSPRRRPASQVLLHCLRHITLLLLGRSCSCHNLSRQHFRVIRRNAASSIGSRFAPSLSSWVDRKPDSGSLFFSRPGNKRLSFATPLWLLVHYTKIISSAKANSITS